jgi:hypothetical protein
MLPRSRSVSKVADPDDGMQLYVRQGAVAHVMDEDKLGCWSNVKRCTWAFIKSPEREIPDPLVRMTNLTEESLALLKAPVKAPTRGKKRKKLGDGGEEEKASQQLTIMDFPVALT